MASLATRLGERGLERLRWGGDRHGQNVRGEGGGADASRAEERLGRGEGGGSHWRGGGGANGGGTGEPTWAAGGVEGGGWQPALVVAGADVGGGWRDNTSCSGKWLAGLVPSMMQM